MIPVPRPPTTWLPTSSTSEDPMGHLALLGAGNNNGSGGGAILVHDTFTDANGTNVTAHTIGPTNTVAATWIADAGVIQIESDLAEPDASNTLHLYVVSVGQSDVTVTGSLTYDSDASREVGLAYREVD